MTSDSDWDLIARCRAGSAAAFEPLVRRHEGPALVIARALLGDPDEAADAVQDAFVRAYAGLASLRPGSAFGPWFRTILRNLCLDRLRAPAVARRVRGAGTLETASEPATGSAGVEREELAIAVRSALDALSADHRQVLVLKEMDGLDYAGIAAALEIPEGTVASRLYHARAALKKVLVARGITLEDVS